MDRQCHCSLFLIVLLTWGISSALLSAEQSAQPVIPLSSKTTKDDANCGCGPVKGHPYSADWLTKTTHISTDGSKITNFSYYRWYRDREGRRRTETFSGQSGESARPGEKAVIVTIDDNVAGVSYILHPDTHSGHKRIQGGPTTRLPAHAPGNAPPPTRRLPATQEAPCREVDAEEIDLGTKVIDGLELEGTQVTKTLPSGLFGMTGRRVAATQEEWYSEDLEEVVLMVMRGPRSGERVGRLTHIVREEPPADYFRVPSDYTIDELPTSDTRQGVVHIETTPSGVEVLIDGKSYGPSPVHATLPVGNHTLSLSCKAPYNSEFSLNDGTSVTKKITLSPTALPCSALPLRAPRPLLG